VTYRVLLQQKVSLPNDFLGHKTLEAYPLRTRTCSLGLYNNRRTDIIAKEQTEEQDKDIITEEQTCFYEHGWYGLYG
jgi:hypothetical protein